MSSNFRRMVVAIVLSLLFVGCNGKYHKNQEEVLIVQPNGLKATNIVPLPIFKNSEIPLLHPPFKKDDNGFLVDLSRMVLTKTEFLCFPTDSYEVVRVQIVGVPSDNLYTARRFLQFTDEILQKDPLPSVAEMVESLKSFEGGRYFWGGVSFKGIPEFLTLFPKLYPEEPNKDDAIFRGNDCSGLLYEAAKGHTPRTTSSLVSYGEELDIQHLPMEEMQKQLKPLDIFVWVGHVLIILTPEKIIESRQTDGVVISDFSKRYPEILEICKKEGKTLHIRRWHPELLEK